MSGIERCHHTFEMTLTPILLREVNCIKRKSPYNIVIRRNTINTIKTVQMSRRRPTGYPCLKWHISRLVNNSYDILQEQRRPKLYCNGEGSWKVPTGACMCSPGFEPSLDMTSCRRKYYMTFTLVGIGGNFDCAALSKLILQR